jgi:hypothetical protein
MKTKIKLVRLDSSDVAVGLKYGDVLEAHVVTHGDGNPYFIVQAPQQRDYYLAGHQVEKYE